MPLLFDALILRYARANVLRSLVTVFAVALGVASAYAIDLANGTAVASFSRSVDVIANSVNLQIFGSGEGFDERTLLRVQQIDGVLQASPIVQGELVVGARGKGLDDGEIVRVLGIDLTRAAVPQSVRDAQSGAPAFDLHSFIDGGGVFISRRISDRYRVPAGGVLRAFAGATRVALPVMAVIPPNSTGVDSSVAFADIATAQTLFHSIGRLDRIDLVVDRARLAAVRGRVERVIPPGARVLEPKNRVAEIQRMLASFTMNLAALADVALLVGMYLIYNAVAISVVQRSSEAGTLRALGASRSQLFSAFVFEGALYGVLGSIAGIAIGLALARFSVAAVQTTVSSLYQGSHADTVAFSWMATLKAFGLGTICAMAAAALPAFSAASTPAARTMRRSGGVERRTSGFTRATAGAGALLLICAFAASRLPPVGDGVPLFGYLCGILAIAGASLETPFALSIVAAALRRVGGSAYLTLALGFLRSSPRRIAVAVASLMVAVAMMVAIAVLVGSFRATVLAWASDTLSADLYVSTPGTADASLRGSFSPADAAKIASTPGVAAVDTFRGMNVSIGGRFAQLGATNMSGMVRRRKLRFIGNVDVAKLASEMRSGDVAAVSVPFNTHFRLGPGDTVEIATPTGNARFRIAAMYNDYSTNGGTLFIDEKTFARHFRDASLDSIAAYVVPGADVATVRTAIERRLRPLVVEINTNSELRSYALAVFDRTFAITNALYFVSIVIAVLGVVSTLFALVLERRLDIALLRYIGLSRDGVRITVLLQALAIGVLAGVLGLALGMGLAADLIYVINRQSFGWLIEWHSPGWFYAQSFGMVVIAAVLAALYPAKVAADIHTGEVLRVE